MDTPKAIIIAAAILAVTAAFMLRWEVVAGGPTAPARLDRWTGKVVICYVTQNDGPCR